MSDTPCAMCAGAGTITIGPEPHRAHSGSTWAMVPCPDCEGNVEPSSTGAPTLRVLICGGRTLGLTDVDERVWQHAHLDRLHAEHGFTLVIEGGATGADAGARLFARRVGITLLTFEADWSLGRKAGPIRNRRMLDEGKPDLVVAFPGGSGTADMVRRAKAGGIRAQLCT